MLADLFYYEFKLFFYVPHVWAHRKIAIIWGLGLVRLYSNSIEWIVLPLRPWMRLNADITCILYYSLFRLFPISLFPSRAIVAAKTN